MATRTQGSGLTSGSNQQPVVEVAMAKRHSTTNIRRAYMARSLNLARLGFADYRQYLASDLWSRIRSRVMALGECYGCGGKPVCVHHSSYPFSALAGNDDSVLYAVCHACHKHAHKGDGADPMVATARLRRIRAERQRPAVATATTQVSGGRKLPWRLWKKLRGGHVAPQSAQLLIETSRLGGELRAAWLSALERNP